MGHTRSWLMVAPAGAPGGTRLYFGSVVVPERNARTGYSGMPAAHRSLLAFHKVYSRMLLSAAARRLA